MKQLKFLSTLGIACVFLFSSCGGGEETSETTTTTDSTVTPESAATPETPASTVDTTPQTIVIVKHKVDDFAKWKVAYDEHDSVRLAFGMHSYVIGRGADDSNMVMVAIKADDVDKAKAFGKDPSLKAAMKKGGVTGTPSVAINTVVYLDTAASMSDLRAMMNFNVKDWDTWKKAFDASTQMRADNGLSDRAYGYETDNNHKVTLVLGITDTAKANAFWKSDMVKQRRAEGGVEGEVKRYIYHVVK
ncbi:MAG: hypothetical protein ABIU11_05750 [Chitinophagaceae bacterium]